MKRGSDPNSRPAYARNSFSDEEFKEFELVAGTGTHSNHNYPSLAAQVHRASGHNSSKHHLKAPSLHAIPDDQVLRMSDLDGAPPLSHRSQRSRGGASFDLAASAGMGMGMEDDGTPTGEDMHLLLDEEIKPALIIRSLSAEVGPRSYPRHLLEDVSAFLYEKEIMVVLGGSGAGKTTLLRSLVAQREDRGRVRYIGDVFTRPYTRIGYLDEDNLLLGNLTVKETLQYSALLDMPGLNDRRVAARVNQWMDRFKLHDVANTPVHQLSSGLRKGLQIAQLLVRSCNLLVLDEPLTGIDSSTAMSIMTELRNLVDSTRINVILSMHQPWEGVLELTDFVMVLHEGRQAYFGPTSTAYVRIAGILESELVETARKAAILSDGEPRTPLGEQFTLTGRIAGRMSLDQVDHLLKDLFAKYSEPHALQLNEELLKDHSNLANICDIFAKSVAKNALTQKLDELQERFQNDLELHELADQLKVKSGFFWFRSSHSSWRIMLDMCRNLSTWWLLVGVPFLLVLATSITVYDADALNAADDPYGHSSVFFIIATMLVAFAQFTCERCCTIYQLYRQEQVDGNHSIAQVLVEAIMCTAAFPLTYAVFAQIAVVSAFAGREFSENIFAASLLLALTAQAIMWFAVFLTQGKYVLAMATFTMLELAMMLSDGYLVPTSMVNSYWYAWVSINPRTWFFKTCMLESYCAEDSCETDLNDVNFQQLLNPIVYGWYQDLYTPGGDASSLQDSVLRSAMMVLFDLNDYTTTLTLQYGLFCLLACLALVAQFGSMQSIFNLRNLRSLAIDSESRQVKVSGAGATRLHAIRFVTVASALVTIISVTAVTNTAPTLREAFSRTTPLKYETELQEFCPDCIGFPKVEGLLNDPVAVSDFGLYGERFELAFRQILETVPGMEQLVYDANYLKPTNILLNVTSVEDMFDTFMPKIVQAEISKKEELKQLKHAEARLARLFMETGGVINIQRLESAEQAGFDYERSADLIQYMNETYGTTLETALAEGRLYSFVRIPGYDSIPVNNHIGSMEHLDANPFALFYRNSSDEDMHTVAIQLGDYGLYPILVPREGYGWEAAKAFLRHAITVHGLFEHTARFHYTMAALNVALEQAFSHDHPIRQGMFHFGKRYTTLMFSARFHSFTFVNMTSEAQVMLLAGSNANRVFYRDADFELQSRYRGLWDENDGLYYPTRPLVKEFWYIASNYTQKLVDYAYETDQDVLRDKSLQKFIKILQAKDGANIKQLIDPSVQSQCSKQVCTKETVLKVLRNFMFSSGLRHTMTLMNELNSEMYFYPYLGSNLRADRLPAHATDYTKEEYLNMFADSAGVLLQLRSATTGGAFPQTPIDQLASEIGNRDIRVFVEEYVEDVKEAATHHGELLNMAFNTRLEARPLNRRR